jgi:hypothetical protein
MSDDINDDIPEDQEQLSDLFGRPSASQTLATLALEHALGPELIRRLGDDDGPPLAIVVQAPGPEWIDPLRRAVGRIAGRCQIFARSGSQRAIDTTSAGNDEVAAALFSGRHCVGISHAPARFLPSSLTTLADARFEVRAPGAGLIRRLVVACAGEPLVAIPANAGAGLGFYEIVGCFRSGATPEEVVAFLAAASSSRTRVAPTDDTPTLQNLAGYGEARTWGLELAEGIAQWRRGDIRWADLSSAAVLHGPPGCGKTLFARSLARTLEVPIVVTSIGELFASTVGHLDSIIKGLQSAFDAARATTPSILFIDELDGLPSRNSLSERNRDWWTPIINFALTLLDGAVTSREGIVLLGATNFVDKLDPALVRPGRFDRLIEIPPSGPAGLAGILRHHLGSELPGADLELVARLRSDGTGALAAQWVRDARAAARAAGRPLALDDLVAVVAPPDRRAPEDLWRVCVHEAGHAVVHFEVDRALDSLSTIRDGPHGGVTVGSAGSPTPTVEQIEDTARIFLAGRAAEEAILGSPSAAAQGDLARTTALLGGLHASQGLGGSLLYRSAPEDVLALLSFDHALRRTVEEHVTRLYAETLATLRRRAPDVERLARALRTRRALTGAEARAIVAGRRTAPGRGRAAP